MDYSCKEAIEFANKGQIEEWIHAFLQTVGNNRTLSDGLKLEKRFFKGPVLIDIDKINRCCGPEEGMEFYNSIDSWETRVSRIQKLIRSGWDMPPLIIQNINGILSIRDGNGRHEALKRENKEKCYVIIWDNDERNLERLIL